MGGDGLGFTGFGDHEELGHDRYCLQEDGEGPEDLNGGGCLWSRYLKTYHVMLIEQRLWCYDALNLLFTLTSSGVKA